jgi:hypothetical protein
LPGSSQREQTKPVLLLSRRNQVDFISVMEVPCHRSVKRANCPLVMATHLVCHGSERLRYIDTDIGGIAIVHRQSRESLQSADTLAHLPANKQSSFNRHFIWDSTPQASQRDGPSIDSSPCANRLADPLAIIDSVQDQETLF